MPEAKTYTVTELNSAIRRLLENRFPFISVQGEISDLRQPYSGHIYFTLKDEQAQLKAVLFKMQQRYLDRQPANGQSVTCRGRLSVYTPRGDYQLIVDSIDFQGSGSLQAAVERLKRKLAAEGLFDAALKRELPPLPEHIVLITSPRGAAVRDFLRIAARRYPLARISVYPVRVQGDRAAMEIRAALETINSSVSCDLIVLCRGGGSLEDLMAFNDEGLVRAVAASTIPVVSAVGHEIDFTLADLASDLRAPTPSAAAEMVLPDRLRLGREVAALSGRLVRGLERKLEMADSRLTLLRQRLGDFAAPLDQLSLGLDHLALRLGHAVSTRLALDRQRLFKVRSILERYAPDRRLDELENRIRILTERLRVTVQQLIARQQARLEQERAVLYAMGPLATLARGYAIVRRGRRGRVITRADQVKAGERISLLLHQGVVEAEVIRTGQEEKTGTRDTP